MKFLIVLTACFALCHSAVIRLEPVRTREGRTLGLLQLGANVLSTGVGAAGGAALTAAGATAAATPLIVLGLGAEVLGSLLARPGNNVGFSANFGTPHTTYIGSSQPAFVSSVPSDGGFVTSGFVDSSSSPVFVDPNSINVNSAW